MKNELLTIDSVQGAKQALNRALQMAVLLMYQKDAEEATVPDDPALREGRAGKHHREPEARGPGEDLRVQLDDYVRC